MKVLINVSTPEDYRFFSRMNRFFKESSWEIDFLANNIVMWLYLKAKGLNVYIVKKGRGVSSNQDSFSVLTGRLTQKQNDQCYGSVIDFLNVRYELRKWDCFVIPSGRLISQVALRDFAVSKGVKTLFVGYANVTGRTFVDPCGTDMQSMLYSNLDCLDALEVDAKEYAYWRQEYLTSKIKKHVVGQARKAGLAIMAKKLIQIFSGYAEKILGLISENNFGFKELKNVKPYDLPEDVFKFDSEYIFFPMQVSTDAQIILNYDGGSVIEALHSAIAIAAEAGVELVVKSHPAEIDYNTLSELSALHKEQGFILSSANTFKLIGNAKRVVTVNSTVGLEAKIVGTPVTFLGNSMYEGFDDKRLVAYLMRYLVPIEYFSDEEVPAELVEAFFDRALG